MSLVGQRSPVTLHMLVADSGIARLMRITGPRKHRKLEEEAQFDRPSSHLAAHELTTDISGRVFESSGRGGKGATRTRHGAASDYDPHAVEIERYVARIAQDLLARHRAGTLSNLILVAEPHLLGVMRARLPEQLHRLISVEISGDYVHADSKQLLRLLEPEE